MPSQYKVSYQNTIWASPIMGVSKQRPQQVTQQLLNARQCNAMQYNTRLNATECDAMGCELADWRVAECGVRSHSRGSGRAVAIAIRNCLALLGTLLGALWPQAPGRARLFVPINNESAHFALPPSGGLEKLNTVTHYFSPQFASCAPA